MANKDWRRKFIDRFLAKGNRREAGRLRALESNAHTPFKADDSTTRRRTLLPRGQAHGGAGRSGTHIAASRLTPYVSWRTDASRARVDRSQGGRASCIRTIQTIRRRQFGARTSKRAREDESRLAARINNAERDNKTTRGIPISNYLARDRSKRCEAGVSARHGIGVRAMGQE